jgi:hypothetical protein
LQPGEFNRESVIIVPPGQEFRAERAHEQTEGSGAVLWTFGEPRDLSGAPAKPLEIDPDCGAARNAQLGLPFTQPIAVPSYREEMTSAYSHGDDLVWLGEADTDGALLVETGRGDDVVYMDRIGDALTVSAGAGSDTLIVCSMRGVSLFLNLPLDRFPDRVILAPPVFENVPPGMLRKITIDGFNVANDRVEIRVPDGLSVDRGDAGLGASLVVDQVEIWFTGSATGPLKLGPYDEARLASSIAVVPSTAQ